MFGNRFIICITSIFIILLMITGSVAAVGYSNYNSNNVNAWVPQVDSFNCYQLDAEYAQALAGGAAYTNNPAFQDWNGPPPPPGPINGVDLPPGGQMVWTLNVPPALPRPAPGPFVNYPEVGWGPYHMVIVCITTDNDTLYGPAAPVDITIEVDGNWQYQGTIWSRWNGNSATIHDGNNPSIPIDFHLNYGQGGAPTWDAQWWTGAQHFILIQNAPTSPNSIWIDEIHLTSGSYF